jgi:deazaflavin-dependent oxidoreductase (nitroreductase family)
MPIPEFDALRHENVLYLTTVGRSTGKPRTIEIWFVSYQERIYLLAEQGLKAQWVRNIQANPEVRMQIAEHRFRARGHVLDDARDSEEWQAVTALSRRKYGWGDGLPVAFAVRHEQGLENS